MMMKKKNKLMKKKKKTRKKRFWGKGKWRISWWRIRIRIKQQEQTEGEFDDEEEMEGMKIKIHKFWHQLKVGHDWLVRLCTILNWWQFMTFNSILNWLTHKKKQYNWVTVLMNKTLKQYLLQGKNFKINA